MAALTPWQDTAPSTVQLPAFYQSPGLKRPKQRKSVKRANSLRPSPREEQPSCNSDGKSLVRSRVARAQAREEASGRCVSPSASTPSEPPGTPPQNAKSVAASRRSRQRERRTRGFRDPLRRLLTAAVFPSLNRQRLGLTWRRYRK